MAKIMALHKDPENSQYGLRRDRSKRTEGHSSVIQETRRKNQLRLMVIGEMGQGKSTLINALVGREVAKEGGNFKAGTLVEIQEYCMEQNGVVISIWDIPGFGIGTQEEERETVEQLKRDGCDTVDLALFCVRTDTQRFPTRVHSDTITKLNEIFGQGFWEHCLFVLTFANNIQQFCPVGELMKDLFSQRCLDLEDQIKVALQTYARLDEESLKTVRAVPVGSHRRGLFRDNPWVLPDREDWLVMFWIECTEHMHQSALLTLLRANYHRLEADAISLCPPVGTVAPHDRLVSTTTEELAEIRIQLEEDFQQFSSIPPPQLRFDVHNRLLQATIEELAEIRLQDKLTELAFAKAMAEGGGKLFQCNIVLHGPPGAGKSSVKRIILGHPPQPKHKQTATDILERGVRTVSVDRIVANGKKCFMQADNNEIIARIAAETVTFTPRTSDDSTKVVVESLHLDEEPRPNSAEHDVEPPPLSSSNTPCVEDDVDQDSQKISDKKHAKVTTQLTPTEQSVKKRTFRLDQSTSFNDRLFDCQWLHHIDSGGQPQFLDVFPLLYCSPRSHFIVVMKLTDWLNDRPKVRYYCDGQDKYCLPDHLVLSNQDMIIRMCQVAQRISRATGGKFTPKVFVVGTHKDQLFPVTGWLYQKYINSKLSSIYEKYCDVLVCQSPGKLMFMMNAMAKGEERQQYTKELQECILSATETVDNALEVPLKWFVFHLELDKGKDVAKLSECLELGEKLGMSKDQVQAALTFLNKAALILYYPDDGPDLVITKMEPLIKRLSKLIKASFIPLDKEPTRESDELEERGVFKKRFLRKVFTDIDDHLLSDEEFLALLETLKIAVSIEEDEYFLPSALRLTPPPGRSSFSTISTPLALFWDEFILPHGFFLTVSVELQQKKTGNGGYVFQLCEGMPHWREEIYLSELKGKIPGVLKLTDRQTWIQVSYSGPESYCPKVYRVVKSATQRAIKRFHHMGLDSDPTLGSVCSLCRKKDHYSILSEDKCFTTCSNNRAKTKAVTSHISCWFTDNSQLETPTTVEDYSQPIRANLVPESPLTILNNHIRTLMGVVSNTDGLIRDLTSAGIISEADITTNQSMTRYRRVDAVVKAVRRCLTSSSNNPEEVLAKFCVALKNQNDDALSKISNEIRSKLVLRKRPDPHDVFELLRNKSAQWEDIAIEFQINPDYRNGLRAETVASTPHSKLDRVLNKWAESAIYTDVTWCTVFNVLTALNYNDVLEDTERFLKNEDILRKYNIIM